MHDLTVRQVSKKYAIRQEANDSTTGVAGRLRRLTRRPAEFWALRGIDFEVPRGQALGIIGHNGAGKSTLLKLLSNITAPTEGTIVIRGRIAGLLEVGSGFHPELTGRENVYLSGSILGMRRAEIACKLNAIIDFAEVRPFIDVPVKRYSSGMFVRLGFAIAAHLDADILLLDEVLAVGDAAFQDKCAERFVELRRSGTTILFISHDLGAVERLCDRVILLQSGQVVADCAPGDAISQYQSRLAQSPEIAPSLGSGERSVEIVSVGFEDAEGRRSLVLRSGEPASARIEYHARKPMSGMEFNLFFYSADGALDCQWSTKPEPIRLEAGPGGVEFSCESLGLKQGLYYIDATIEEGGRNVDWRRHCATIHVERGPLLRGRFYMPHRWRITQRDADPRVVRVRGGIS